MTITGLDAFGSGSLASPYSVGATATVPERLIAVRIKDPHATAAKASPYAALASSLLPEFVSDEVYKKTAEQLGPALAAKGVDADVTVVDAGFVSKTFTPSTEFRTFGLGIGLGAAVILTGKIIIGFFTKR